MLSGALPKTQGHEWITGHRAEDHSSGSCDFSLRVAVARCRGRKSVRTHMQSYKIEEPEGCEGSHKGRAGLLGTWPRLSSHGKHMPGTRHKRYFRPHR